MCGELLTVIMLGFRREEEGLRTAGSGKVFLAMEKRRLQKPLLITLRSVYKRTALLAAWQDQVQSKQLTFSNEVTVFTLSQW